MNIRENLFRRFSELEKEFGSIRFTTPNHGTSYAPDGNWRQWATSAEHLISAAFKQETAHTQYFRSQHKKCTAYEAEVRGLFAIFLSAKQDYEGGYLFDHEATITGEILGDFVQLAMTALANGHKDVAAVLASAALEDALKRFAALNKIETDDSTMQAIINALKSKGLVGGAQKSILETMPKFRNSALHADWSKYTEVEVAGVLGFVQQFLLTKFGS